MKYWTAEELHSELKDIKLNGNTCLYSLEKCSTIVPQINAINKLKEEKNAIVLAHSYVTPDIIHTVADFVGDSYELSKRAKETSATTIIFSAVLFMAETAKLLNPDKTVIVPSHDNGCSLADSITGDQVKLLRNQYPEHTFFCYINTRADVKAECDVCVTSSNVYSIIENHPNDKIYFLPDRLMGQNLVNEMKKRGCNKTILFWDGTCYVHEEYEPEMIDYLKLEFPDVQVVSHPECHESIIEKSDFVGSTSQMVNYVKQTAAPSYFMLTECGLTSRLQLENPEKKFIGSCTMCKYMKANQLSDILKALSDPDPELIISIPQNVATKAINCIDAMFAQTIT
jgi:quinolinate synthase